MEKQAASIYGSRAANGVILVTTKKGDNKKLTDVTVKNTYYITEGAVWRLKEFLEHCGVDLDNVESLAEGIEETPGKQVGVFINHEASQDGTSVFARIGKTFVVE